MRLKKPIYILLFSLIAILLFSSGSLFKKAIDYKHQNRKLILQNDSLQGVVINLNRTFTDTLNSYSTKKRINRKSVKN
jgi:hypothetical protein